MKRIIITVLSVLFVGSAFAQLSAEKQAFADKIAYKKAHPSSTTLSNSGADAFGYRWKDNTEPDYDYSWTEISGTGTDLIPELDDDDEIFGPFNIGFSFPFYGSSYTQFYVNTNGTICFDGQYITLSYFEIPGEFDGGEGSPLAAGTDDGRRFIAWHWTDLVMYSSNGAKVYYQNFGTYAVIQFQNYAPYDDDTNLCTAQVVLYQNGNIEIRYKSFDDNTSEALYYASVGIQGSPTKGMSVDYDDPNFFENQKSILITSSSAVPVSGYAIMIVFMLVIGVAVFRFLR